jgi:hypothetical protein
MPYTNYINTTPVKQMANYEARGYYIDPNGRRGEFVVNSPSSSRSQIERIVRNRYDVGREVRINYVDDGGRQERERQDRQRRDNERQEMRDRERQLETASTHSSSAFSSSSSSSQSSYSAPSGGGGCATLFWVVVGIVAIGVFGGGEGEDGSPSAPEQSYNAPMERVVPAQEAPQWEDYATPPPSYCVTENFEPC